MATSLQLFTLPNGTTPTVPVVIAIVVTQPEMPLVYPTIGPRSKKLSVLHKMIYTSDSLWIPLLSLASKVLILLQHSMQTKADRRHMGTKVVSYIQMPRASGHDVARGSTASCGEAQRSSPVNERRRRGASLYGSQTLTNLSVPPDARTFTVRFPPSSSPPSETIRPQARQEANGECASIFFKHRPVLRSQMRMVLSSAADRRYFPEGWKVRAFTQLSWPTKVHKHCPRSASQSFIVLSREALATKVMAKESVLEDCTLAGMATSSRTAGIDTDGTNTASWTQLSCPRNSVFVVPDSISTIRAV